MKTELKEREIARKAVTVVKNENNALPLNVTKKSKVLMLCPYTNEQSQMQWDGIGQRKLD